MGKIVWDNFGNYLREKKKKSWIKLSPVLHSNISEAFNFLRVKSGPVMYNAFELPVNLHSILTSPRGEEWGIQRSGEVVRRVL